MNLRSTKTILAFTLIELVIVVAILSILSAIIITVINPVQLFADGRNSTRKSDLSSIQSALSRYIADSPTDSTMRSITNLAGYSTLLSNATTGVSGYCPSSAINGVIPTNITGSYNLDITGTTYIDLSLLLNGGYLKVIPKDPSTQSDYKACIDTLNGDSLVIYSSQLDNTTNAISKVFGDIKITLPVTLGLHNWYDASQISGISNGAQISSIVDLSGNGFNATQPTGSIQPTYTQNAQNSLAAMTFDGLGTDLITSDASVYTDYTVYAIYQPTLFDATSRRVIDKNYASGFAVYENNGNNALSSNSVFSDTVATTVNQSIILEGQKSGTNLYTKVYNYTTSSTTTALTASNSAVLHIGSTGGTVEYFKGNIFEIAIFSRALNATELTQMYTYFHQKWNI